VPKLNRVIYIIFLVFIPFLAIKSQVTDKGKIITVTGIISDEEKNPVSGVSIMSKTLRRGTISELSGIYNVISLPGDTIWFSALGFKHASLVIPQDIESDQLTKDIILLNDTIVIKDVLILPWKNYEAFKRAVLAETKTKPEIINMYENLAAIQYSILNTYNYKVTPEAGFRMAMQQNNNASMIKGQYPSNNLLNPFAWAKFFNGIKNGMLKNQKSSKPANTRARLKKKKS
jgi:hypothetical protein